PQFLQEMLVAAPAAPPPAAAAAAAALNKCRNYISLALVAGLSEVKQPSFTSYLSVVGAKLSAFSSVVVVVVVVVVPG
ncbi:hypothetical protein STEG23_006883, partial [Scotinomys teguina]